VASGFADLTSSAKEELWAVLALRHSRGIGTLRANRLVENYGTALAAVEDGSRTPASWAERGGIPLSVAREFASGSWRQAAGLEWAAIKTSSCSFIFRGDARYPGSLAEVRDAPLLLYYRGDVSLLQGPAVGVVGARNCTREGIAVSAFFSRDLARAGVSVISGMAKGIDRAAHLAGLKGVGRSIAVLGTGLDVIYPSCNADLYELLGREGLLLSEFPPGTAPLAAHFPVRNRLISGLAQGVLVIEAAKRSGSLITARLALEQGREVFAVPGHTMAARSAGCRELIRRGAKPVFTADDILVELAPQLGREARTALEKRLEEGEKAGKAPARNPAEDSYDEVLAGAEPVLPEGLLPWLAAEDSEKATQERFPPRLVRRKRVAEIQGRSRTLPQESGRQASGPENEEERRVLSALGADLLHIDQLTRALDLDVARLSGLLALLEVRGLVRRAPRMYYSSNKYN
jgi:DNA processing protein